MKQQMWGLLRIDISFRGRTHIVPTSIHSIQSLKANKSFILILLMVLLMQTTIMLPGCKQNANESKNRISVVCTIFPQYDWVRQILGKKVEETDLTLLLNNRIDLHSYQPSVDDFVKISNCDLFIYVGGASDAWVDEAIKQAKNKDMLVISLLEILGDAAKIEEIIEGMEDEEDEYIDHEVDGEPEQEIEYDEHVWLSLKNAQLLCLTIFEALSSIDSNNTEEYKGNLAEYLEKLKSLDLQYQTTINAAPMKMLLFGDRFPFRYLVDDYNISYYAAFAGCSAETEASFETIIFLAGKVDDLGIKNIIVTESTDKKIAETIIRETMNSNQQILVLDDMQSVTLSDVEKGTSYLSIMKNNLVVLNKALQ